MLNFELLTEADEVLNAQRKLEESFKREAERIPEVVIGFQGGDIRATAYWHSGLGVWGTLDSEVPMPGRKGPGRFWNAFGSERPVSGKHALSRLRLNAPRQGIHRSCGALFATDEAGRVYLLHRGHFNRIRKERFFEEYSGDDAVVWDGRETRCVVVAEIGTPQQNQQIAHFVAEVERIKGRER